MFDRAAARNGALVLLLLAAFGWGALHALSPGHGKAMVAAYLVGAKGTARHAVILGITVTVTHTIGVFALGFVTLALSHYILPEELYPWLNLVSGVLVLIVGGAVLRARLRGTPEGHDHAAHEHPDPSHSHSHDHSHDHSHSHSHGGHGHSHSGHSHSHAPDSLSPRTLLAAGATAGLIPCPSALVVLLGALAQDQIVLGLVLILVFSLGLATTLTGLGLAVVSARRLTHRGHPDGRLARWLAVAPAVSAVVIIVVGFVLTARAVPGVV